MRSEADVPLPERVLYLEGEAISEDNVGQEFGFMEQLPNNASTYFVTFSYADIPVGKTFDVVFPINNPELGILCESRIIAVSQQFGHPWDTIPHGWKTICRIQFPFGIPPLVHGLPKVDGWYQNSQCVGICNAETWGALTNDA